MGLSVHWSCFAILSWVLCLGCEVGCTCTEDDVQIDGGSYKLTKLLQPGSMLTYQCPENYYPYPAQVRVCQADGSWQPRPRSWRPQRCNLVECPDPKVLQNGNVSPSQERYYVGNETKYNCLSGYERQGSSRRVCLPNGKWSGSTPICSRNSREDCPDPGVPAGTSRLGVAFEIDDKVKYTCNGNLFMVGSSERVCQENGQWTGKEPVCYYKYTYDTALEVSEAFGSAIRETLTTLQNDTQDGRKIRITKSGVLNIYIAMDISNSIDIIHVVNATQAVIKLIEKIGAFSVTPNYEILFFSSEIYEISNIVNFFEGTADLGTIKKDLEKFKIGRINTDGTDLNLAFKTFLERMAIIKEQTKEQFKEHRHVIILFSDGAFNMGGPPLPTVEKIKKMVYMNQPAEREDYLDIYSFAIGAGIHDDELLALTAGVGRHYFRMKDITNLQKTFDETIDESDVKDLCGLHKEYKTGERDELRTMYPWWAYVLVGTTKCLGSLVTKKFVLTAASCFKFGDVPADVTIEIDDGDNRVRSVKNFFLHPKYNVTAKVDLGVKKFYDYDVALLELEEEVTITSAVRPICIPCTKATSDALQLVGASTCKQQEDLLLKKHLEKLSFLTKTGSSVDLKNVQAKLNEHRDGCIKFALKAEGITADDPKVAVTDNFICTGGLTPQRDDIACPGDSGGAVFKNYQHRTIQVAVVSWGSESVCSGSGGLVESTETSRDFHINLFRVVPFLKKILGNDNQDRYIPLEFLDN